MTKPLTIYGDQRSGNCMKVYWTASLLGVAFEWIDVDVLSGETRERDFLSINPAGQLPAVVFADGSTLAQSNAIILHLAREHKQLLPKDSYLRAKVDEWLFWEQYSHEPVIAVRRFQKLFLGKDDADIDPGLLDRGNAALALMDAHLATRDYFVGGALSVADIALFAYTHIAPEGGFELQPYPHIQRWIQRLENDLAITKKDAA